MFLWKQTQEVPRLADCIEVAEYRCHQRQLSLHLLPHITPICGETCGTLRQYHRYSRRIPQPFGQDLITSVATHTSMHITVNIRPPHSHYERLSHRDIARVMWQWRKPVFPKAKSESSSIFGDPNRSGWIQPLLCVVCKQPIRHASWNGIYPPIGDKPPLNLPPRGQGSRVNTPIFPVL